MKTRQNIILITGFFLFTFLLSGLINILVKKHIYYGNQVHMGVIGSSIYAFSESLPLVVKFFKKKPSMISNKEIPNGVKFYSDIKQYKNHHLLTSSFQSDDEYSIQLVNIENGKTIKKWIANLDRITELTKIGKNSLTKWQSVNVLRHPIMTKDSSIIAETGYSLVKLDKSSNIEWVKSNYISDHSIEFDHEENIWISGRRFASKLKGFFIDDIDEDLKSIFRDDLIMKIDPKNGDVFFEKSVIQILKDNNLYDLVAGNYEYANSRIDPIHLNDVQPALIDGDFWKKGDLLLSSRHLSTVFLYRPSENKVLWYKKGPWLNQHDPDFLGKNKISVFGNQVYEFSPNLVDNIIYQPNKFNSIFVYNFENDSITEPFKKFLESEKIKTYTSGRSEILPNGDLFIEDTNSGRVFIGDSIKKKVSFSRRLNEDIIFQLHWSRIIIN